MMYMNRISKVYDEAFVIPFNNDSKIVIMSDCHRGDGSYADNFANNHNLFMNALTQYFHHGYTYIELGDGDELWENDKISEIMEVYDDVFWLLARFHQNDRLYMVYGNHDIIKSKNGYLNLQLKQRERKIGETRFPLFPEIKFHEGLVLSNSELNLNLFLIHGHQADFFNDRLWRVSCFLVRHLWRPLELLGIKNPTSAATNPKRKKTVEKVLIYWAENNNIPVMAGHTHRAMFPNKGQPCYFNSGSCVHPRYITALEIVNGNITLVKWSYKTRFDGTVFVGRDQIDGPEKLEKLCP